MVSALLYSQLWTSEPNIIPPLLDIWAWTAIAHWSFPYRFRGRDDNRPRFGGRSWKEYSWSTGSCAYALWNIRTATKGILWPIGQWVIIRGRCLCLIQEEYPDSRRAFQILSLVGWVIFGCWDLIANVVYNILSTENISLKWDLNTKSKSILYIKNDLKWRIWINNSCRTSLLPKLRT